MKPFESFMASHFEEYAVYRNSLGYAKKGIRPSLLAFDRYLKAKNANWDRFNPAFFLELRGRISNHPNTANTILSNLRSFFDYLVRRQILGENPLKDIPPLPERYFIPFVFSPEQTDQLLNRVCKNIRRCQKHFLFDTGIYLATLLLARCGMRITEPLRLLRHHYRVKEGTVYIERTKFRKDRLIPVPKAVLIEIENYLAVRNALCPCDQNPYLLAGKKHKPLEDCHIRKAFHRAVDDIDLKRSKQTIGNITFGTPLPHSLRHYAEFRIMPS